MSFPRYPKYKDSGVEWLRQVPDHWTVCALKRIVRLQSGETIRAERIAIALTAQAERAIDLLQERRTALISAAVTGQIDVRGLVPAEASA